MSVWLPTWAEENPDSGKALTRNNPVLDGRKIARNGLNVYVLEMV